jgi:hypothetical protein
MPQQPGGTVRKLGKRVTLDLAPKGQVKPANPYSDPDGSWKRFSKRSDRPGLFEG